MTPRKLRPLMVISLLAAGLVAATPSIADACLHVLRAKEGTAAPLEQTRVEFFVAWNDQVQDLLVRTSFELGEGAEAARRVAFVIPIPTTPYESAVAPDDFFETLSEYVELRRSNVPRKQIELSLERPDAEPEPPPLVVEAPQRVGPYTVHSMKANGDAGLNALNGWMEKNGFAAISKSRASYYVDRGWTFLAVEATPESIGEHAPDRKRLPPLHVRFATPRLVIPLKLLDAATIGSMQIYLVTSQALTAEAAEYLAVERGFETTTGTRFFAAPGADRGELQALSNFHANDLPESVSSVLESIGPWAQNATFSILTTRWFGAGVNNPARWEEDITIPRLPPGERVELGGSLPEPPAITSGKPGPHCSSPCATSGRPRVAMTPMVIAFLVFVGVRSFVLARRRRRRSSAL